MWNQEQLRKANGGLAQPSDAAATAEGRLPAVKGEVRGAALGGSVCVTGDITGAEDLVIDGQVEGRIDLPDHTLTIGPNATVLATITANVVTVFGSVVGSLSADRVDVRQGGSLEGTVTCARLAVQDGAHFCTRVEMPDPDRRSTDTGRESPRALATVA